MAREAGRKSPVHNRRTARRDLQDLAVETSPEMSRKMTVDVVDGGEMRGEHKRVRIRVRGGGRVLRGVAGLE